MRIRWSERNRYQRISEAKGDPIYEVRIGKIRCADFCGGIFEGTFELRLSRGYPTLNQAPRLPKVLLLM